MHTGNYLQLVSNSEEQLAQAFRQVAGQHGDEPDIYQPCQLLAAWSDQHAETLRPLLERYADTTSDEPERLHQVLFHQPRTGSLALLRDLHDLWLLASEVSLCWMVLLQAAQGLRDAQLRETCQQLNVETDRQLTWLITRIKQAAPQTLIVAE